MSEFLMSSPIFLPSGKGCFKLSTALFRFGRSDAHIVPLLRVYNPFVVYHASEHYNESLNRIEERERHNLRHGLFGDDKTGSKSY
jgi:hypothetical protein